MNHACLIKRWDWCEICDRDRDELPAEVREIIDGVCVECWLESYHEGMHGRDELPAELRALVRP